MTAMSSSVLYMSMSLDRFIAGPNDAPGNPGGDDFMRLHEWCTARISHWTIADREEHEKMASTKAGRNARNNSPSSSKRPEAHQTSNMKTAALIFTVLLSTEDFR
jgi:hypothetical protein